MTSPADTATSFASRTAGDSFESMVLGDALLRRDAERFESNNNLSDRVAETPGAIGFVGLSAVREAKLVAVSAGTGVFITGKHRHRTFYAPNL